MTRKDKFGRICPACGRRFAKALYTKIHFGMAHHWSHSRYETPRVNE